MDSDDAEARTSASEALARAEPASATDTDDDGDVDGWRRSYLSPQDGDVPDQDARVRNRRVYLPVVNGDPVWGEEPGLEESCFPHLHPTGRGGSMCPTRDVRLPLRDYCQARLRSVDSRFGGDEGWVFRALTMINQIDMARAINFCLNRRLDAGGEQLTATQALEVVRDEGTAGAAGAAHVRDRIFPTVGRCIRGSQHYWDAARRRLVSMVATLGSPTLFFTATFDDRNCVAMYNAVDSERFPDAASVAALTSQERTAFVNANTAFITRFIYHRWQTLLAFLESDATPLGHAVRDFFWRCEEQGRGTLHFHSVLWLDTLTGDADDVDRQRRLLQWTMDYITTATPNDDSVLAALVPRISVPLPAPHGVVRKGQ